MIKCCFGYNDEYNKCNNEAKHGGKERGYCDYHWGYSNGLWRALETFCGLHWTDVEPIVGMMMDKPGIWVRWDSRLKAIICTET